LRVWRYRPAGVVRTVEPGRQPSRCDADRRAEINKAIADLKCAAIDADEAALRRKYASQPSALAAIDLAKATNIRVFPAKTCSFAAGRPSAGE
jgi:hypothetical protein